MNPDIEQLAQLIFGVSESLHREMHEGFTRVNQRFDVIDTLLNRQGALIDLWLAATRRFPVDNLERKRNHP